jgi:hypothetical protein
LQHCPVPADAQHQRTNDQNLSNPPKHNARIEAGGSKSIHRGTSRRGSSVGQGVGSRVENVQPLFDRAFSIPKPVLPFPKRHFPVAEAVLPLGEGVLPLAKASFSVPNRVLPCGGRYASVDWRDELGRLEVRFAPVKSRVRLSEGDWKAVPGHRQGAYTKTIRR